MSRSMRARGLLLAAMAVVLSSASARAADLGFRFDEKSQHCRNTAGEEGLNPGFLGQCGDLSGANLKDKELAKLDLRGANLAQANLEFARLIDLELGHANLNGAKMAFAQFYRVDMAHASLQGADLHHALLFGTFLCPADLSGANLTDAAMYSGSLSGATLANADLRNSTLVDAVVGRDYSGAKYNARTRINFVLGGAFAGEQELRDHAMTPAP